MSHVDQRMVLSVTDLRVLGEEDGKEKKSVRKRNKSEFLVRSSVLLEVLIHKFTKFCRLPTTQDTVRCSPLHATHNKHM